MFWGSSRNKVEFSGDRKLGVVIQGGGCGKEGRPWMVRAQEMQSRGMRDSALSPVIPSGRCFRERGVSLTGCTEGEPSGWRLRGQGGRCVVLAWGGRAWERPQETAGGHFNRLARRTANWGEEMEMSVGARRLEEWGHQSHKEDGEKVSADIR